MIGVVQPFWANRSTMIGTAFAASSLLTVTRTISEPARASAATCWTVLSTSAVSVFVIDCTTTGASEPTQIPPIFTVTARRRCISGISYPIRFYHSRLYRQPRDTLEEVPGTQLHRAVHSRPLLTASGTLLVVSRFLPSRTDCVSTKYHVAR